MRVDETAGADTDPIAGENHGFWAFLDQSGRWLMERPYWSALAVVLALTLLPVAVWLDLKHLSDLSLTRQATDLNAMVSDIRSYYARNVVGRIVKNHGETTPTTNYRDVDGGIPVPATLSIELANVIGKRVNNVSYRFVSDKAFTSRAPHQLSPFEISALETLRESRDPLESVTQITGSILKHRISMAVPVVMGNSCVACHNSHPQSPKLDWKIGDIRGIQSISIEQPLAANILSFRYLLLYLFSAGSFGLIFATLQWRQAVQFSRLNVELEEKVRERTRELALTQDVTIFSLSSLSETRDNETGNHIRRTQHYVKVLAEKLADNPRYSEALDPETIELFYKTAPLHDIGKVGVPDSVLQKPGGLTPEEYTIMKKHTLFGRDALLEGETTLGSTSFLGTARDLTYSHHEKWDGSGYPEGLKGDAIPLCGRLMAIADVYDALISKRVYKAALPHEEAVDFIRIGRGAHFDPYMVDAFVEIADEFAAIATRFKDD